VGGRVRQRRGGGKGERLLCTVGADARCKAATMRSQLRETGRCPAVGEAVGWTGESNWGTLSGERHRQGGRESRGQAVGAVGRRERAAAGSAVRTGKRVVVRWCSGG
jgi:hypothetical protein